MYIHGQFVNLQGDTCSVYILTKSDKTKEVEIGTEDGILFSDDPAETSNEVNDTFDHLLKQSAKVRLLCREYVADFFCASCKDAVVNMYVGDKCVFAGFIEPQSYSMPYNDIYDEIELNCIDVLSALQYSKYKNIGALGVTYALIKSEAAQRSFYDIFNEIITDITSNLDIVGGHIRHYYYDGSKAIDSSAANHYSILSQLSISDLLFMGDDEDDVWQQDDILEEIFKYLNLHIAQVGFDFYIFSWESVKSSSKIAWKDLISGESLSAVRSDIEITNANASDTDTNISIDEIYNQLLLTDKIKKIESIIESPLDDDLLKSPFANKQKYMTEYSADGEGKKAYKAFYAMTHDESTNYGAGTITDWFMQVMQNSAWTFSRANGKGDLYADYSDGSNQQNLPIYMGSHNVGAIIAFGSVQINTANDDNSPTSKVDMSNYLVISVNGNEIDNDENKTFPSESALKALSPMATYNGNSTGGVFSPGDEETTNYIVLSGKVILNPVMHQSGMIFEASGTRNAYYKDLRNLAWVLMPSGDNQVIVWHSTCPSRKNKDGRYYTQKFWGAQKPSDEVSWSTSVTKALYPYTGEGPQDYEFKYSAVGDSSDKISKVSVLQCMLIIGDKCVVEKQPGEDLGTGVKGTGNGQTSDFVWKKYKERSQCTSDDEYFAQSFAIGFDPKIGDKLIGTEFSMQNNISYTMGIDAEGIAIPIKKSDKISGVVKFMILGPVNVTWDEITRRHPTFFRHTKWSSSSVPLMAHVSSIMLKSFEVKVYSDNGFINNNNDDNDVVYMSDTVETFNNKKDDLEFKFTSQLTADECLKLGVSNDVKMSTPLNVTTGDGVASIYDYNNPTSGMVKPEQRYVDSYYNEYHKPRVIMEQKLIDPKAAITLFDHYTHPAMGKTFFIQGMGLNLKDGEADITLKEINND